MKRIFLRVFSICFCMLICACSPVTKISSSTNSQPKEDVLLELVNPTNLTNLPPFSCEVPSVNNLNAIDNVEVVKASLNISNTQEVRAVWISYLEMQSLLQSKTKEQFTKNISQVFDTVKKYGLNTVIVQVRPFADALYNSEYFPWSYTITGTEGKNPGFDPLEIMVAQAKSRNIRFDAWVNPYRVRAANNTNALSENNQAKKWLAAKDDAVISYKGAISYNPASKKARELIVNGIVEIVRNYDVDAIHIDDYFYASTDVAYDSNSYNAYINGGGKLSLANWRRSNVEQLIKAVYSGIKAENPNVLFGISPQANVQINYEAQYLDVKKIASTDGYCDYISPQVYYGFKNEKQPFSTVIKQWNDFVKGSDVDLYIGVAAYKIGTTDNWAGTGKDEWLSSSLKLKEMIEASRNLSEYDGFALYRYDSIFKPASSVADKVKKERDSLAKILK